MIRIWAPALLLAGASVLGCTAGTFVDDVAFLRTRTEVVVLRDETGNGYVAVCPELQGRVMTSTCTGQGGRSHGWINRELIASGERKLHINAYGGEDRFWLGPEGGQFSVFFKKGDPFDLEHWQTPAPIDSEPFELALRRPDSALLRKRMRVTNASGTVFDLDVQREIRVLGPNEPGRILGIEPGLNVRWVGFESRNRIANLGDQPWTRETGALSVWILGMFNPSPSTVVVVPYYESATEKLGAAVVDDYFGKVPADRLKVGPTAAFFKGDGQLRSKIGVTPQRARGLLGSWDPEAGVLTVVHFNQPAGVRDYVNSQWKLQKEPFAGDAINSYNDGPAAPGAAPLGPFYELETSSPALFLKPGFPYVHSHRTFHFQGPRKGLDDIARRALGVGLEAIEKAF
jgi:hypothetical protein